mmetsp:Transcript_2290/g.5378  ORF Transcript_2290/g.5378 Transcript_2290/m.5378 type:complete len:365 (-) Transcript_2290:1970-3064(-)
MGRALQHVVDLEVLDEEQQRAALLAMQDLLLVVELQALQVQGDQLLRMEVYHGHRHSVELHRHLKLASCCRWVPGSYSHLGSGGRSFHARASAAFEEHAQDSGGSVCYHTEQNLPVVDEEELGLPDLVKLAQSARRRVSCPSYPHRQHMLQQRFVPRERDGGVGRHNVDVLVVTLDSLVDKEGEGGHVADPVGRDAGGFSLKDDMQSLCDVSDFNPNDAGGPVGFFGSKSDMRFTQGGDVKSPRPLVRHARALRALDLRHDANAELVGAVSVGPVKVRLVLGADDVNALSVHLPVVDSLIEFVDYHEARSEGEDLSLEVSPFLRLRCQRQLEQKVRARPFIPAPPLSPYLHHPARSPIVDWDSF